MQKPRNMSDTTYEQRLKSQYPQGTVTNLGHNEFEVTDDSIQTKTDVLEKPAKGPWSA